MSKVMEDFKSLFDNEAEFREMLKEDWHAVYADVISGKNSYSNWYETIIVDWSLSIDNAKLKESSSFNKKRNKE